MSNPRFVNKTLKLNYNTIDALSTYFANGGTITVCKQGRRSKANTSFPMIKGTIANRGAKQVSLTNVGVKAKG